MAPNGEISNAAGVVARPPLLFLAALVLGFVSDRLLPLRFPVSGTDLVHWMIAGSLILIGLALVAAGIRNFSRAATPVPTNQPTRTLVTTGEYAGTVRVVTCFEMSARMAPRAVWRSPGVSAK